MLRRTVSLYSVKLGSAEEKALSLGSQIENHCRRGTDAQMMPRKGFKRKQGIAGSLYDEPSLSLLVTSKWALHQEESVGKALRAQRPLYCMSPVGMKLLAQRTRADGPSQSEKDRRIIGP